MASRRLPILLLLPLLVYGGVALFLLPLALLSKRTDVAIKVVTSEVRFEPGGDAPLFSDLRIRSFVVQSEHSVSLGGGCLRIGDPKAPCSPLHTLSVAAGAQMTVTPLAGTMTVNRLLVPAGARVSLRALDGQPPLMQVQVDGSRPDIPFAFDQALRLACTDCWRDAAGRRVSEAVFRPDEPQLGHIGVEDGRLSLTLEPAGGKLVDLDDGETPRVRHVAFVTSVDGRPVSAIRRAEVTPGAESGDGKTWNSTSLRLGPDDDFMLTALTLAPDELTLSLKGKAVSRLSTDEGDRMPSWLDWMMNNRSWVLYFNAIAAIGSVILSVMTLLYKVRSGADGEADAS